MPSVLRRAILPLFLTVATVSSVGCSSDSPTEPTPPPSPVISLAIVEGDGQLNDVNAELPLPIVLVARTSVGAPVAGRRVTFTIQEGGGTLAGAASVTIVTDESGRASVRWTLGGDAGLNRVRAFLTDAPEAASLFFTATARLREPRITLTSLSNAGEVGTFLSPPVATLTGVHGEPLSGVAVTFAVVSGGGSLTAAEAVTNADGVARVGSWRLGTISGPQTISASASGMTTATLTVEALPGAPVTMLIFEGDDQTATVMTRVSIAPAVKFVDRYGNGVPRIEVFFKVGGESGAFVLTPFERTNASGVARTAGWQLGLRPGSYSLTVNAPALPIFSVSFSATAVAGAPAALQIVEGDNQTAPIGTKLPIAPAVRVTDTWGNPLSVAGITVVFTPRGTSGIVAGAEQVTNADGIARVESWTIGPITLSGGNLLTAEAAGLRATTFRATGF